MITFLISITILIAGYFTYGKFLDKFFGADPKRDVPAISMADGVDYKVIKPWKIFIIQFLNIAGLGPIFGAIMGAAYGPLAYLWIVLGCVFMGATHDYIAGMLSLRHNGASLNDIIKHYLG
ncbi:MAG: carbon starvation protein A, partial [Bacteroidales bacterium]|nr:carbon starvation protein A [Bacteroidales bacterium]